MQRNTDEGGSGDKSSYRQLNLALQRSVLNVCSEYINYEKQVLIKATFVICADENETVVLGIEELLKYDIQVSRKKDKNSRRDDSPVIVAQSRKRTGDDRDGEARKRGHVDGGRRHESIDVDVDCIEIADDDDHGARANRTQMSRRDSSQFAVSPGRRAVPPSNAPITPRRLMQNPGMQQQNRNMPQFADTVSPGNQVRPRNTNRRVTFGGIRPGGPGNVQQMRMRNVGQPMNQGAPPQTGQYRSALQNVNSVNRAGANSMYNQQAPGQANRTYTAAQQHQQQQMQQHQLQQQQLQQQQLQQQQQQHQLQQQQQLQQLQQQQFSRNTVQQPVTNGNQTPTSGVQYQHAGLASSETSVSNHAGMTYSAGPTSFQNVLQTVDQGNQNVSGNIQYEQVVTAPTENGTPGQANVPYTVEQVQYAGAVQPQTTPGASVNAGQQATAITSTEQLQGETVNTSNGVTSPPVLTNISASTTAGSVQNQSGQFFVMPQLQITDVVSLQEAPDGTKILIRRNSSDSQSGVATTCSANVVQDTSGSAVTTATSMPELRECSVALVRDSTNGNIVGHVALSNSDAPDQADQGAADSAQFQPLEGSTTENTSEQQPTTPDAAPSSVSSDAQMSDASASQDQSESSAGSAKPTRATRNSKTAANVKMTSLQHQSLEEELEEASGASGDHGGRKWGCEICSKSFRSQSGLKVHRLLHSDYRPYKCECSRGFTTRSHYKSHLKTCPKATQSAAATATSPVP